MGYEERYKELFSKLVSARFDKSKKGCAFCTVIDSIMSELAESESEDERIRKEIINYLSTVEDKELIPYESWIAWLEKQSTPQVRTGLEWVNTIDDACDKRYLEEYAHGEFCHEQSFKWGFQEGVDWLEKQCEKEKFIKKELDCIRGYRDEAIKRLNELEKQGEKKPTIKVEPKFKVGDVVENIFTHDQRRVTSIKDDSYITDNVGYIGFYDQDDWVLVEQKPADKVEPKFHKGDWCIDNEDGTIFQIVKVLDNTYTYKTNVGKEYSCTHYSLENDAKLWTIQDAKDGDVLFTSSTASHETFVFKNIDEKGNAKCYFAYDSEDGFREGKYHFIGRATDCKPATKEQCNLLFQKMKEADYEWDADKKELKKIEQKPVEWSEKDETMLNHCMTIVDTFFIRGHRLSNTEVTEVSILSWFKSLKDRCLPQPKQEWSEEDEYNLAWLVENLYGIEDEDKEYEKKCRKMADWLKSLRPQPRWKPSDLPHWKKSTLPNDNTTGFNSDYFCHKGYNINYKELFEKLPKDD